MNLLTAYKQAVTISKKQTLDLAQGILVFVLLSSISLFSAPSLSQNTSIFQHRGWVLDYFLIEWLPF